MVEILLLVYNIFFVISWHWPGQGQTPLLACWQDGWQVPYWKTSLLLKYVFEDNTWPLSQSCFMESSDTLRIGDQVWQLSNQLRIKKVPLVFFFLHCWTVLRLFVNHLVGTFSRLQKSLLVYTGAGHTTEPVLVTGLQLKAGSGTKYVTCTTSLTAG